LGGSSVISKVTAYTHEWIITQSTSKDVVPGKEVPFGGLDDYIFNLGHLNFRKTTILGPILTGIVFFAAENRFNMGMFQYTLPLIVIVAP